MTGERPLNVIKRQNVTRLMFSLIIWAEPSHISRPQLPGWKLYSPVFPWFVQLMMQTVMSVGEPAGMIVPSNVEPQISL